MPESSSAVAVAMESGLIRKAMAMRVKYRVRQGDAPILVPLFLMCVHPSNRGGVYPQPDTVEGLGDLEKAGVTEVIIAFRNPYDGKPDTQSVEEKIGMLHWYADNVIQPYRK